jgi:pimeloyl-ACP methyl ester carboxylesterase
VELHQEPRVIATALAREQTRARYPDQEGYVERDGVRVFYEVYGSGAPTVLLLPTWSFVHSRHWKLQIPYLARHCRVVTFDGRGNGRSDRPQGAEAYAIREFALDALAVLDATVTERVVVIGVSCATLWGVMLAAEHPGRVAGAAFISPSVPLAPPLPERTVYPFDEPLDTDEGWAKYNMHHWLRDYRDFLEFFVGKCFTEAHSTKQIEDVIGWALETTPEVLADHDAGIALPTGVDFRELCARVRCPVLVMHGDQDALHPHARGVALAEATAGQFVTLEGSGHFPQARDPVKVNLLLRDFITRHA